MFSYPGVNDILFVKTATGSGWEDGHQVYHYVSSNGKHKSLRYFSLYWTCYVLEHSNITLHCYIWKCIVYLIELILRYIIVQIPVAAPSKAWFCGRSLAGIVGSNPIGGHGCQSVVSVVCCQVEVSGSGWSRVQRSPKECGVSNECDRGAPVRGGHDTEWRRSATEKDINTYIYIYTPKFYILTLRLLMSYIYGAPILDVSRSHTTTQHSR